MHVLLTGASSGIGEDLAKVFARAGHAVTLVARRQAELERVASACGSQAKVAVLPADLSDSAGAGAIITRAEERLGPVEVLVNNAGMEVVGRTVKQDPAVLEKLLLLNLITPLKLMRAVLPAMLERGGTIVNVSSVAGFVHPPFQSWYSASKAGLSAASNSLRAELRGTKVRVITVYPGPVRTPMGERAASAYATPPPAMPWGRSDELALRIVKAVERGRSAAIVYPRFYWFSKLFSGLSQQVTNAFGPGARD